jgi:hypothetical protein
MRKITVFIFIVIPTRSKIYRAPPKKGPLRLAAESLSWLLLLTISRRSVSFLLVVRRKVSMADRPSDLVQGTLDMLILKTLALDPCTDMESRSGSNRGARAFSASMQVRCLSPFSGCNEMA